jgi:hypothetical protein
MQYLAPETRLARPSEWIRVAQKPQKIAMKNF